MLTLEIFQLNTRDISSLNRSCRGFRNTFQPCLFGSVKLHADIWVPARGDELDQLVSESHFSERALRSVREQKIVTEKTPLTNLSTKGLHLLRYCRDLSVALEISEHLHTNLFYESNALSLHRVKHEPWIKGARKDIQMSAELERILAGTSSLRTLRWTGLPLSTKLLASLPERCPSLEALTLDFKGTSPTAAYDLDRSPNKPYRSQRYASSRVRWYSELILDDGFTTLPRFGGITQGQMPWSLRSFTFLGIPLMREREWHVPLANLLSVCPNLEELSLGLSDEMIKDLRRKAEILDTPWSFLFLLCRQYKTLGVQPLNIRRLVLGRHMELATQRLHVPQEFVQQGPQLAGWSPSDLASAHLYLGNLLSLKELIEVRLPPATTHMREPWRIPDLHGMATFTKERTPKLRILGLDQWLKQAKDWLAYSDPSFVQQVALIVPQRDTLCLGRDHLMLTWLSQQKYSLPRMLSLSLPGNVVRSSFSNTSAEWGAAIGTLRRAGPTLEGLSLQFVWDINVVMGTSNYKMARTLMEFVTTWICNELSHAPNLDQLWIEFKFPCTSEWRDPSPALHQRFGRQWQTDMVEKIVTWIARRLVRETRSKIRFVAVDWNPMPVHSERPCRAWKVREGRESRAHRSNGKVVQRRNCKGWTFKDFDAKVDLGDGWVEMELEEIVAVELFRGLRPLMGAMVPANKHNPILA